MGPDHRNHSIITPIASFAIIAACAFVVSIPITNRPYRYEIPDPQREADIARLEREIYVAVQTEPRDNAVQAMLELIDRSVTQDADDAFNGNLCRRKNKQAADNRDEAILRVYDRMPEAVRNIVLDTMQKEWEKIDDRCVLMYGPTLGDLLTSPTSAKRLEAIKEQTRLYKLMYSCMRGSFELAQRHRENRELELAHGR
jgi:hypothetical protein